MFRIRKIIFLIILNILVKVKNKLEVGIKNNLRNLICKNNNFKKNWKKLRKKLMNQNKYFQKYKK